MMVASMVALMVLLPESGQSGWIILRDTGLKLQHLGWVWLSYWERPDAPESKARMARRGRRARRVHRA